MGAGGSQCSVSPPPRLFLSWGLWVQGASRGSVGALGVPTLGVRPRLFLSRGADPEVRNKEGDSPLDLTPEHSEVWVALELTRKLRQGAAGRALHTERIISR